MASGFPAKETLRKWTRQETGRNLDDEVARHIVMSIYLGFNEVRPTPSEKFLRERIRFLDKQSREQQRSNNDAALGHVVKFIR